MRLAVAHLTLGNGWMVAPVAEGACERLMLCRGLSELCSDTLMAWYTETTACCHIRRDLQRMMGLMTTETVNHGLAGGMGIMTLGTVRDLAMGLMAEIAGLLRMLARVLGKLLSLLLMTGQTGLNNIACKNDGQRVMGIGMACQAILELKVRTLTRGVTHGTLGNNLGAPRTVLKVAVKTGYCGLVLARIGGNSRRFLFMTFHAIGWKQLNLGLDRCDNDKQRQNRESSGSQYFS